MSVYGKHYKDYTILVYNSRHPVAMAAILNKNTLHVDVAPGC